MVNAEDWGGEMSSAGDELGRKFFESREEETYALIVKDYSRLVYNIALGVLNDADLAGDAVQETFLGLLRTRRPYRGEGSFQGWLGRIAFRSALNILKAGKKRREHEKKAAREQAGEGAVEETSINPDWLRKQVAALPHRLRLPLVLKYFHEIPQAEIADILDCSTGTVSGRLKEALSRLRGSLARVGLAPLAGVLEPGLYGLEGAPVPAELLKTLSELGGSAGAGAASGFALGKAAALVLGGAALCTLVLVLVWSAARDSRESPRGGKAEPGPKAPGFPGRPSDSDSPDAEVAGSASAESPGAGDAGGAAPAETFRVEVLDEGGLALAGCTVRILKTTSDRAHADALARKYKVRRFEEFTVEGRAPEYCLVLYEKPSDANGIALFGKLPGPGSYEVRAWREDFGLGIRELNVKGVSPEAVRMVLSRKIEVTFRFRCRETGKPLPGVMAKLGFSGRFKDDSHFSGANGELTVFSTADRVRDGLRFIAKRRGYDFLEPDLPLSGLKREMDIFLTKATGRVAGHFRDSETQNPIPNAELVLQCGVKYRHSWLSMDHIAKTDEKGEFEFKEIPEGRAHLWLKSPGAETDRRFYAVDVQKGENRLDLAGRALDTTVISVFLEDGDGGRKKADGFFVQLRPNAGTRLLKSSTLSIYYGREKVGGSRLELSIQDPGPYRFIVDKPGFLAAEVSFQHSPGSGKQMHEVVLSRAEIVPLQLVAEGSRRSLAGAVIFAFPVTVWTLDELLGEVIEDLEDTGEEDRANPLKLWKAFSGMANLGVAGKDGVALLSLGRGTTGPFYVFSRETSLQRLVISPGWVSLPAGELESKSALESIERTARQNQVIVSTARRESIRGRVNPARLKAEGKHIAVAAFTDPHGLKCRISGSFGPLFASELGPEGIFSLCNLPPGHYRVMIQHHRPGSFGSPRFDRKLLKNTVVEPGKTAEVNFD
jgi:RNA polymerase sigma-70 factor (ECF subfamily)